MRQSIYKILTIRSVEQMFYYSDIIEFSAEWGIQKYTSIILKIYLVGDLGEV